MMVVDRPLVAARHDHHRTVLHIDIVDHDANRGEILVGVRVERPILVPFDGRAIAGRLHVELAGVETQAAPQIGQQFNDLGVAAGAHVDRVDRMWRLQPAHPRLVRRVRVLEVINRVVGGHRRRRGNELVGHPTQLRDLLSRKDVGDDYKAIAIIVGALCSCEHLVSPQGHFSMPRSAVSKQLRYDITQDCAARTMTNQKQLLLDSYGLCRGERVRCRWQYEQSLKTTSRSKPVDPSQAAQHVPKRSDA
jgi:hypothetical protein